MCVCVKVKCWLFEQDDEDVFILTKISDIIHAMFGTHKEEFLPLFNKLLPQFTNLIVSTMLMFTFGVLCV